MTDSDDLFAINPEALAQFDRLGGKIPVLLVDNIFADPLRVRQTALDLPYEPAGAYYPGRKARVPEANASLTSLLTKIVALVSREYLTNDEAAALGLRGRPGEACSCPLRGPPRTPINTLRGAALQRPVAAVSGWDS